MRVGVLGPLEVEADGRITEIAGARLRVLLARLALDAGRMVTVESLSQALWPDEVPGDPAHALQSLVSRLRRALPGPAALRSVPGGYCLDLAPEAVDALRFERLAREGRRAFSDGDAEAAARRLREALALWRGEPLADVADAPFAVPAIVRLSELRLAAIEDRVAADLERPADRAQLIAELADLTAAYPLRERLRCLLVQALHADSRQAEALATYQAYRELLADQLGADPGPELQAAHLAVLRGEQAPQQMGGRRPRGNLRAALSSFVGRQEERARLARQLNEGRLVTLTGPGGAGKTRLAITVAAAAAGDFRGGVWLAELAPVTDPGDVAHALTSALGLRDEGVPGGAGAARDALSLLAEALAATETLIVLDNCEHLIGAVAAVAEELLGRCPRLRMMATSREPLRLAGEVLCPVPPLGLPEPGVSAAEAMSSPAVRLFTNRAAAVAPGFMVTDTNAAAVGEVCRRLDGLPLAIELAAARLRSLPLAELAARLGGRFGLLTAGTRTAPPRHQTLYAVVAWSWDLLNGEERALAERLSVFPGSITPHSAEAVRAHQRPAGPPALDLLTALADKSLLQAVPGNAARYRMLETIREFGLARLTASGELAAARSAHAAYFLELAETAEPQLRGTGQLPWLAALTSEHDNLLAALHLASDTGDADAAVRLATALGMLHMVRGSHSEAARTLRLALEIRGEAAPLARTAATALWAFNAALSGSVTGAEHVITDMQARVDTSWQATSAHPVAALAGPALLVAVVGRGIDPADDAAAGLAAIDQRLAHPNAWTRAMLWLMRALLDVNHGDMGGMRRDLAAAAEAFRVAGERWGLATSLAFVGYAHNMLGEFGAAVAALEESVRLLGELGSADGAVMQRVWLADALRKDGQPEGARAELLAIAAPPAGPPPGRFVFFARIALGDLARFEDDLDEAARQYGAAARDLGSGPAASDPWRGGYEAMLRCAMGHLAVARGDLAAAGQQIDNAIAEALAEADTPVVAMAAVAAARLRSAQGAAAEAAEMLGAAHALRGASDAFNPDVAALAENLSQALGERAYRAAYDHGCQLDRAGALALVQNQPLRS
jgi:predicted ATPase